MEIKILPAKYAVGYRPIDSFAYEEPVELRKWKTDLPVCKGRAAIPRSADPPKLKEAHDERRRILQAGN